METSAKLLAVLNLLGVAQALLLAAALLSVKRGNRVANRFLAAFVLTLAVGVGGSTMASEPLILLYPHLLKIQDPVNYLGAPLLFLYVRTLLKGNSGAGKRDLLHFLPFSLCFLFLAPFYFQSGEAKLISIGSESYFWHRWGAVRSTILIVQVIIYLSLIALMLRAYSRSLKRQSSPAAKSILFQVRFLLTALASLWVVGVFKFVLTTLRPAYDTATVDLIVPAGLSVFVYAMGYMGLRRPEVLTGTEDVPAPPPRYEKSTLTPERSDTYLRRLLDLMKTEKPYLDGDLTLQKLAKALAISPHHLSQTINEHLNQNFFDFINAYRIEEAKRMLLDPAKKHYSILAVSEEVGFNSKSAFNTAFKKHVRMTPSEFRKIADGNGQA
ncbi:MAG TPA: AraC family transcriptional regulator [Pyrinomonadaceae bacterium]|nr:AraC family transcriptional regulator [Pyrinomonadaceae bacterium]